MIINRLFRGVFFAIFGLLLVSCTKELNVQEAGFEKSFRMAKEKYNNGNYTEALLDFNKIILNYGGENGIDSVQFLISESHFYLDEFYSASYEFIRLTENFPESEKVEESYFKDAECYYNLSPRYTLDQKETHTAISKYQLYIDLYQKGKYFANANDRIRELREKLARKEFAAGELYLKLDQPRAAKVYFNEVIDKYYDTSFYISALEKISQAFLELKDDYNYHVFRSKYNEMKNKHDR
jgi:outer membrane protein assembly factor BamD